MSLRIRARLHAPWVLVAASLVTACQSAPDLEALRTTVIAEAPGAKLTGGDLERWLMASPELPTVISSTVLTNAWVDQALFAEAMRQGFSLDDSASVDSIIWADAAMSTMVEFFTRRHAGYPAITDVQADSLFDIGDVRVFQQLILDITPVDDEKARQAAEGRAAALKSLAATGEDFTPIIRSNSDDPATREAGGIMPATTRDGLPEGQMSGHLWTLRPGDFSRVYSSGESVRLFLRPAKTVARPALKAWLAPRLARVADSIFIDSMLGAAKVTLAGDAFIRMRTLASGGTVPGETPLVTWENNGALSVEQVSRRWMASMEPIDRARLAEASDAEIERVLRDLAQREMVLRLSGQTPPTPAQRTALVGRYREVLAGLRLLFQAGGATPAEVPTRLMDSLTIARRAYTPIPRGLAGYLRMRYPVQFDSVAQRQVLAAVVTAYAERRAGDSTTTPSKAGTPPSP